MTRDNLFAKAQAQPGEGQPGEGQPGEGMPPQGGPGHVPLSSMTGHSLTGARH
jgi:hypothetical protein